MKTNSYDMSIHLTFRISESLELEIREFIKEWNEDNSKLLPIDISSLARISIAEFINNRKIIKKLGIK